MTRWHGLPKELSVIFKARGVPLQLAAKESSVPADLTLTVRKYQLINHRASGFSAWESYNDFLRQVQAGELYREENGVRYCTDMYLSS